MNETLQMLIDESALWLPKLSVVIVLIVIFYLVFKILSAAIRKVAERLEIDKSIASLLQQITRVGLLVLAIITILGTLGINVTALVAGLGLTGFALGFALKDTISNLLSGIMILLYRPFRLGDTIAIAGFEGEVLSIDLRYTQLKAQAGKVLIPNSKLFTDPITVKQPAQESVQQDSPTDNPPEIDV